MVWIGLVVLDFCGFAVLDFQWFDASLACVLLDIVLRLCVSLCLVLLFRQSYSCA